MPQPAKSSVILADFLVNVDCLKFGEHRAFGPWRTQTDRVFGPWRTQSVWNFVGEHKVF